MLTTKSIDRKEKKEETAVLTFVKTATAATSVPAVQLRRKNKKTKEKGGMKKKKRAKRGVNRMRVPVYYTVLYITYYITYNGFSIKVRWF